MTAVTLRPNGTVIAATSVNGAATTHAALNDDLDSSYCESSGTFEVDLGTVTLPAGSVSKQMRARARSGQTGDPSQVTINPTGIYGETPLAIVNTGADAIANFTGAWFPSATPLVQGALDSLIMRVVPTSTGIRTYELYADLVYVAQPVTNVTAVTPDPYTASNYVPITWANTLDADGGSQTHWQVAVFTAAQYGVGGFDPAVSPSTEDTGIRLSGLFTHFVGPLSNGVTYRAYVRIAQTVNGVQHWSDWDYDEFGVDVDTSDIDTVVAVANDAIGALVVTVERDVASEAWNFVTVERSIDAGATWQPVRGATYVDATADADTFVVTDYEAPNSVDTIYQARATRILSSLPITGEWVESDPEQWTSTAMFLKVPGSPELNVSTSCLASRTPYRRTRRTGVFNVLGARLPVVVSDVRSARSGLIEWETLTSAEAAAIDTLLERGSVVLVQFPPSMDIADMYAAFTDDEEMFMSQVADNPWRTWSVNYIEVAQPPDPYAGE